MPTCTSPTVFVGYKIIVGDKYGLLMTIGVIQELRIAQSEISVFLPPLPSFDQKEGREESVHFGPLLISLSNLSDSK